MMLRQDTETIWIFGLSADQISVMKRCVCIVTGRYDRRTARTRSYRIAVRRPYSLPFRASGLRGNSHARPMSDGLKA